MRNGVRLKKTRERRQRVTTVEPGSGNVFADLELPNAREALAKAQIADRISAAVGARKLTQVQAAELLGIDQPKVSALLRGRLEGFSTDRLMRFLNALGHEVEIVIRPVSRGKGEAGTRVVMASD